MVGYCSKLWRGFASILVSLWVTLTYLFTPAITVQYPTEKRRLPQRALTRHALTVDLETGKLKCTACEACARICPARCIELEGEGKGKERRPKTFVIDHNLCMYCNLCVEVCPFDAITMWTGKFELGGMSRTALVYDLKTMTADRFYPTPMTPELPLRRAGEPTLRKSVAEAIG